MSLDKFTLAMEKFTKELESIAKTDNIVYKTVNFMASLSENEKGETIIVYDMEAKPMIKEYLIKYIEKDMK